MKRICSSPSNILWEQIVNPAPPPDREAAIYRALYRLLYQSVMVVSKMMRPNFCEKPVKNLHKKAEQPDGPGYSATTLLLHNEDRAKVVIFRNRAKKKKGSESHDWPPMGNDKTIKMEKYSESVGQTHRGSESGVD